MAGIEEKKIQAATEIRVLENLSKESSQNILANSLVMGSSLIALFLIPSLENNINLTESGKLLTDFIQIGLVAVSIGLIGASLNRFFLKLNLEKRISGLKPE
ncbi:MAG: hypothetical protein UX86_C0019G0028 [Candidatus Amesbacteria bacterium GW2011_GWC1_47_15]|uniref:Uncharacterized protein n=1 Tax=Candidatus Amesbacteria bacterium GW2011_GWC1_47_15 TaxID=1618364 RepID=A0A0G1UC77_9BACT|nr:MAG: hypothetical protein UX86_C0019G0028 [Candidatus Amesbacteria bacterium GW2011_GWC1_47_15]